MAREKEKHRPFIKRWWGLICGSLGLTGLIWYISNYSSEFYRLSEISLLNIILLSMIILLGHILIGLKILIIAKAFHIRLSLFEGFLLAEAGGFLNLVPLNLGTGLRAVYLKKVHKLKFVNYSLGFIGSLLTNFMSAGILGMIFILMLKHISYLLHLVFLLYLFLPLGLLTLAWIFKQSKHAKEIAKQKSECLFGKLYRSMIQGLDMILKQPQLIIYWFIINLLTGLILGSRFWLISKWLAYPFNFASGMVLQSVDRVTAVITIMPSGTVGLREAFTGLGAKGLGSSVITGVMISTIDRIIATGWIILLGSMSLFILRKRMIRAESDQELPISIELL